MSEVACFLLEPTTRAARSLRRYTYADARGIPSCSSGYGHDAQTPIGDVGIHEDGSGCYALDDPAAGLVATFDDDDRWPLTCAKCGYVFDLSSDDVVDQDFWNTLWRRADGRPIDASGAAAVILRDAPAGAMYWADWYSDCAEWRGPDGRTLVVVVPHGHPWIVDGRASNCDSPCATCGHPYLAHQAATKDRAFTCARYVDAHPHKCWVRHGEPPIVTVDKLGVTCNAGAGSIQTPKYHGFLVAGRLQEIG